MHSPAHAKRTVRPPARTSPPASPSASTTTARRPNHRRVAAEDNEKMRYPEGSPARKRVPWSPSKTMMQSPGRSANNKLGSLRSLPVAPLAGGGSRQTPPVQPYAATTTKTRLLHTATKRNNNNNNNANTSNAATRVLVFVVVVVNVLLLPVTVHRALLSTSGGAGEQVSEQAAHAVPAALSGGVGPLRHGHGPQSARRTTAIGPDDAAAGAEPAEVAPKTTTAAANSRSENNRNHNNKKKDEPTARKRKEERTRKEAAATTTTTAAGAVATEEGNNNNNNNNQNNQNDDKEAASVEDSRPPRFAYVYLVGGCDPARPAYRQFLYNIMVSTHLQRQEGSKSDVIVLVQMSSSSNQEKLPDSDLAWLRKRDIQVRYVPTPMAPQQDSFDQLMLDKLTHVVRLTEYERVLFADADMLLRGSLDYLFRLSVAGVLAPNVVFAGRHQPAQGGLFMVAPEEGDADVVQKLIEKRRRGQFDVERGWGRAMNGDKDDHYELVSGKKGRHWDFGGADADEGLLYHFVKYEKKSVSIFQKKTIRNWGVDDDGNVAEHKSVDLDVVVGGKRRECWATTMSHKPCQAPHSDYVHFPGKAKPWLDYPQEYLAKGTTKEDSPHHFWWKSLQEANTMFELGLDFDDWKIERPLLGLHANHLDAVAIAAPKGEQQKTNDNNQASRFAYAYVIGGCDPDKPAYRSFLQNILTNTNIQREEKSTADVVVFFQMLFSSEHTTLPDEDLRLLNAMNIQVEMIPKSEEEGFDKIMMEKFRILELKQYERILYLDGDVMVRGSLDYLFTLSKEGKLKRNVIFADEYVPAAGSIFMVTPKEGNWDRVLELVREKEDRGSSLPTPHWDETVGWGHKFGDGDADVYELLVGKKGSSWDFLGASSDLGLLYHWAKYEDKSVSIIMAETVQHWDVDDKGNVHLGTEEPLEKVFKRLGRKRKCWAETLKSKPCITPHSDFVHFPSTKKPWLHSPPKDATSKRIALDSPLQFWFYSLSIVNKKLGMGLDYSDWKIEHRPLLGMHPSNIEAVVSVADTQENQLSDSQHQPAEYAYAYVIGGCNPEKPAYVNYFYDILINTYLQRQEGSTADVVVFVQMGFESAHDTITEEDQRIFNAFNIKVEYIPKAEDESFYRIMLDKFLTLGLTQYKRVMFLDGDVMTRGSMDYLFDLSIQGVLKENVVFAGSMEPANGGTFMLTPKEGSWDRVLDIIREKEERGAAMPYPHWNETIGWGHEIEEDDYIQLLSKKKQKKWNFYGGFADQGLLYHWTKYVEKSVSIVFRHEIQNWGPDENGKVHVEKWIQFDELEKGTIKPVKRDYCWKKTMKMKPCVPPHSDFVHFTGTRKPWLGGPPENFGIASERESARHYWFYVLDILNKKLDMKLDFDNWSKYQRPSLGMYPKKEDVAKTSYAASAK